MSHVWLRAEPEGGHIQSLHSELGPALFSVYTSVPLSQYSICSFHSVGWISGCKKSKWIDFISPAIIYGKRTSVGERRNRGNSQSFCLHGRLSPALCITLSRVLYPLLKVWYFYSSLSICCSGFPFYSTVTLRMRIKNYASLFPSSCLLL